MEDLHKVWEVKALVRKPNPGEAQKILEKVAKQVQPIMRKRGWRVKLLSEFCPDNPRLLGLNVGGGVHVKLRLRRANRDLEYIPYDQVLDTMLHELCHNAHGPHNASFYNLWDELRKECEELISKGISGSGEGFNRPGRRLGGIFHQPPLSALRQSALDAAKKRANLNNLMPSGAHRLGGDSRMMAALSPVQAAAMAAERRLNDEIWCGSQATEVLDGQDSEDTENFLTERRGNELGESCFDKENMTENRKRKCKVEVLSDISSVIGSGNSLSPVAQELSDKRICRSHDTDLSDGGMSNAASGFHPSTSTDLGYNARNLGESIMWECNMCTFLNPPHAPLCALCCTKRPQDKDTKRKFWSCKFCTLENSIEIDKCVACEHWRYSHGMPVSTRGPNVGT